MRRVRRICGSLPDTVERVSHGEPTFFSSKKVCVMFANNHHHDGRIAVWVAALPGEQAELVHLSPEKYFVPPYVGKSGWIGIELDAVSDEELAIHIRNAWALVVPKKSKKQRKVKI